MNNLLNKIFPPKCLFCGTVGALFCNNCLSNCGIIKVQKCIVCDKPSQDGLTHFSCHKPDTPTQLICAFEYKDNIRVCIKRSKYNSCQFQALKILSREALGLTQEWSESFRDFVCVPIPLSKEKFTQRGFNQAQTIALIISTGFKAKIDSSILFRIKGTKAQHGINREERFKNISGSFLANREKVLNKKVLLVDDICTTGSTFLEASRVLYEAGAKDVRCFALSKKV